MDLINPTKTPLGGKGMKEPPAHMEPTDFGGLFVLRL